MDAELAYKLTQISKLYGAEADSDPIVDKILEACMNKENSCMLKFKSVEPEFLEKWRKKGFVCEVVDDEYADCDCDWGKGCGCPVMKEVTFSWENSAPKNYVLAE